MTSHEMANPWQMAAPPQTHVNPWGLPSQPAITPPFTHILASHEVPSGHTGMSTQVSWTAQHTTVVSPFSGMTAPQSHVMPSSGHTGISTHAAWTAHQSASESRPIRMFQLFCFLLLENNANQCKTCRFKVCGQLYSCTAGRS